MSGAKRNNGGANNGAAGSTTANTAAPPVFTRAFSTPQQSRARASSAAPPLQGPKLTRVLSSSAADTARSADSDNFASPRTARESVRAERQEQESEALSLLRELIETENKDSKETWKFKGKFKKLNNINVKESLGGAQLFSAFTTLRGKSDASTVSDRTISSTAVHYLEKTITALGDESLITAALARIHFREKKGYESDIAKLKRYVERTRDALKGIKTAIPLSPPAELGDDSADCSDIGSDERESGSGYTSLLVESFVQIKRASDEKAIEVGLIVNGLIAGWSDERVLHVAASFGARRASGVVPSISLSSLSSSASQEAVSDEEKIKREFSRILKERQIDYGDPLSEESVAELQGGILDATLVLVKEAVEKLAQQQKEIERLTQRLKEKEGQISALTVELRQLKKNQEEFRARASAKDGLEAEKKEWESKRLQLEEKISGLELKILPGLSLERDKLATKVAELTGGVQRKEEENRSLLQRLNEQERKFSEEKAALEAQAREAQEAKAQADQKLAEAQLAWGERESALQAEIDAAREAKALAEQEKEEANQRLAELTNAKAAVDTELARLNQQLLQLQQEAKKTETKAQASVEDKSKKLEEKQQDLDALQAEYDTLLAASEEQKEQLAQQEETLKKQAEDLALKESGLALLRAENDRLKEQCDDLRAQLSAAHADHTKDDKIAQLSSLLDAKEAELKAKDAEIADLVLLLETERKTTQAQNQQMEDLRGELRRAYGELNPIKSQLENKKEELQKVTEERDAALAECATLRQQQDDLKLQFDQKNAENKALTKELQATKATLVQKEQDLEAANAQIEALKKKYAEELRTKDEEIAKLTTDLEGKTRELVEAKKSLAEARAELSRLQARFAQLEAGRTEDFKRVEEALVKQAAAQESERRAREELAKAGEERTEFLKQLAELDGLKKQLADAQEALRKSDEEVASLKALLAAALTAQKTAEDAKAQADQKAQKAGEEKKAADEKASKAEQEQRAAEGRAKAAEERTKKPATTTIDTQTDSMPEDKKSSAETDAKHLQEIRELQKKLQAALNENRRVLDLSDRLQKQVSGLQDDLRIRMAQGGSKGEKAEDKKKEEKHSDTKNSTGTTNANAGGDSSSGTSSSSASAPPAGHGAPPPPPPPSGSGATTANEDKKLDDKKSGAYADEKAVLELSAAAAGDKKSDSSGAESQNAASGGNINNSLINSLNSSSQYGTSVVSPSSSNPTIAAPNTRSSTNSSEVAVATVASFASQEGQVVPANRTSGEKAGNTVLNGFKGFAVIGLPFLGLFLLGGPIGLAIAGMCIGAIVGMAAPAIQEHRSKKLTEEINKLAKDSPTVDGKKTIEAIPENQQAVALGSPNMMMWGLLAALCIGLGVAMGMGALAAIAFGFLVAPAVAIYTTYKGTAHSGDVLDKLKRHAVVSKEKADEQAAVLKRVDVQMLGLSKEKPEQTIILKYREDGKVVYFCTKAAYGVPVKDEAGEYIINRKVDNKSAEESIAARDGVDATFKMIDKSKPSKTTDDRPFYHEFEKDKFQLKYPPKFNPDTGKYDNVRAVDEKILSKSEVEFEEKYNHMHVERIAPKDDVAEAYKAASKQASISFADHIAENAKRGFVQGLNPANQNGGAPSVTNNYYSKS